MRHQVENPWPQMVDLPSAGFHVELRLDAMRKNPYFVDIVMLLGIDLRFDNISFDDREVVGERDTTHEHEVFLIMEGVVTESLVSFIDRQTAEMLPCDDRIEVTIERIEVRSGR